MKTITELANNLHQVQQSAKDWFGEEEHTAHVANGYAVPCDNCEGGFPRAKYCWQHHAMRLITSSNGPGYIRENKYDY